MRAAVHYWTRSMDWWDRSRTDAENLDRQIKGLRALGPPAVTILAQEVQYNPARIRLLQKIPFLKEFFPQRGPMDAPEEVRHRATYFLGKLGPEARSAIPALLRLVSDSDARVRSEVAFALGRIGDSSIVVRAALTQMQADSSRDVQFAAAISLWSFDPTDLICIQQVEDLLSPSYLSWPSICLKNIGGGAKIFAPALLRAIESTPWSYSRMQAVDALWVTKGDKAPILDELESLAKALASPGSTNKFSGWTDVEDSIGYAVIYLNGDKEFRDRLKPLLQSILRNPSSQAHKMAAFYFRKFSELDHRDIANAQPESHPAE